MSVKTPKLLIVTTIPGTITAFLLPFAEHFRSKGWRVDALANGVTSSAECKAVFDQVWDIAWSRNPLDIRNLFRAPQIIQALVAREGYDIVHVHTPVAAFVTRFALRQRTAGVKVVYTAHGFHFYRGGSPVRNPLFRSIEWVAGRWTDALVVINREDEQAAKEYRLVAPEQVHYMPGIGVDTQRYRPDQITAEDVQHVRQELGLRPEDRLFLIIAEFIPRKRHRDAVLALAQVSDKCAHLALAGDGPLLDEIKRLAVELNLADRVHFLGFRRDIPTLVCSSTATLLPSAQEGLPRSVMESLALGVPVIGSDIRGVRDLLEGGCGIIFKVGDTKALADAMRRLIEHPEEARAMGERGRQWMATFDLKPIIALHEQLYRAMLETTDAPRRVRQ